MICRDQAAQVAASIVTTRRKSTGKCVYRTQRKADKFRLEWDWVERSAKELEKVLLEGRWNDLPLALAKLLPRFSDIKLTKMTRTSALWTGAYEKLLREGAKDRAAAR